MFQLVKTTIVVALAYATVTKSARAAEFIGLGDLPGGPVESFASGVSADGSVVIGESGSRNGSILLYRSEAFRWTRDTGMVALGNLPGGSFSEASDVSADGSVVVGEGSSRQARGGDREAYRWTAEFGMTGLGDLPGGSFNSRGISVSADGSVVVGRARGRSTWQAYRWTEDSGMTALLNGDSHATGVSADGSVVVGYSTGAFRWTAENGVEALGDLPGGGTNSRAYAVSADGSTVVGFGIVDFGPPGEEPREAFRWTAETGMVGLGGDNTWALAVSADGSTVVGTGEEAFIWNETNGLRNLKDVLVDDFRLGSSLEGWTLTSATDISANGRTIVGNGTNSDGNAEGWIAMLDDLTQPIPLQSGDADQDLDFDQLDLVKVQVANKYLTGHAATWGEGDWNGAPGGSPGNPPVGDGLFDQFDIIAANIAGVYLQGPYAAIQTGGAAGDGQTSLVYNAGTGELSVDAPAGQELTSINVTSAGGRFVGNKPATLDGAFDNFAADNVFKATFGGSFGSIRFGNVLPVGIAESDIAADLSAVGSLAGGGDLGNVDLVYVPEPTSMLLLIIAFSVGLLFVKPANR